MGRGFVVVSVVVIIVFGEWRDRGWIIVIILTSLHVGRKGW